MGLKELGEALDDLDDSELPHVKYKCNKCGREVTFVMYAGIPRTSIPCGLKCGGILELVVDKEQKEKKNQEVHE